MFVEASAKVHKFSSAHKIYAFLAIMSLSAVPCVGQTQSEVLNKRANLLSSQGKLQEASLLYTKAIFIDPNSAQLYYNRGKAKLNMKDYNGAIRDFDFAIKLMPKDADAYNNRGIAKKKNKDVAGAISDYNMALKHNPHLYRVYLNRGIARFAARDAAGACSDFHMAVAHGVPNATDALVQAGCR